MKFNLFTWILLIMFPGFSVADTDQTKATSSGEVTFTVRTVTAGGNYSPKHVLAIWIEDVNGFVKTRKAMANQRIQYLYTWKAASNFNVVDAITGPTLTSHQTHTVSWDCTDLDGEIVPDGDYVIWVEFTEKHDQGPLYNITFTKGPDAQSITPPDETYFKDIELEFTPYVADFSFDVADICQWETVTFTDESVNAASWEWNFGEGAAPETSTSQGPHTVYYTTPGAKTVSLTINGSLTETKENLVAVTPQPEADFTYAGTGLTVAFTNNTTNATTYLWDFGDGNNSTENNPTHIYATAGTYAVTLTANNFDCEDGYSQELAVPLTGIINTTANSVFEIFPNPNNGIFEIRCEKNYKPEIIRVTDQSGRTLITIDSFDSSISNIPVDMGNAESGIYYLMVVSKGKSMAKKIIIK
ncbi:MAG: DUF2271 domain-containing protein [Bacteroidales bacterium]|nr:DUF2271 domain-containing protein [Bacteroidales bacterium]